ncbi:CD48 antigen-like [Porphyrio hochstetteri]
MAAQSLGAAVSISSQAPAEATLHHHAATGSVPVIWPQHHDFKLEHTQCRFVVGLLALGDPWCRPCLGDIIYGCGRREKMVLTAAIVLLAFITQARAQRLTSEVAGAVGGVACLSPSTKDWEAYPQVHWRYNSSVKIAIRENKEIKYSSDTYKGRLKLFPNNTLKISSLEMNDSGMYQVYLEDKNGNEEVETILLTVYDLVPKPTVEAEVTRDDSWWCNATLKCSVELEGVTYEWIKVEEPPLSGEDASQLKVSHRPWGQTYTCKVRNPVSFNSASLTYRQPCSWTVGSSAPASYTMTGMMVALGLPLLLLTLA